MLPPTYRLRTFSQQAGLCPLHCGWCAMQKTDRTAVLYDLQGRQVWPPKEPDFDRKAIGAYHVADR